MTGDENRALPKIIPLAEVADRKLLPYSRRTLYAMVIGKEIAAINISRGQRRPRWGIAEDEIARVVRSLRKNTQNVHQSTRNTQDIR